MSTEQDSSLGVALSFNPPSMGVDDCRVDDSVQFTNRDDSNSRIMLKKRMSSISNTS